MTSPGNHSTSRHGRRFLIVSIAVGIAATACGRHRDQPVTAAPPTPAPPALSSQAPLVPPEPLDASYRSHVEDSIATRLHLTPAGVVSQLRTHPGSTLLNLAKPLGLADDQLAAIVTPSLRSATDAAVRAGRVTPADAARLEQYSGTQSDANLISEVSYWYLRYSSGSTP